MKCGIQICTSDWSDSHSPEWSALYLVIMGQFWLGRQVLVHWSKEETRKYFTSIIVFSEGKWAGHGAEVSNSVWLSWSVGEDPVSKWLLLLLFITFGSWVDYMDKFLLLVHIKWIFLLGVHSLLRTEHFQSFPVGTTYFFSPILAASSPLVLINVRFLLLKKEEKVNNL